jgi:hypothetical protein
MEQDPKEKPSPFDSPTLRREAGEGWHVEGLNKRILGAIVAREAISNAMGDTRDEEERASIMDDYNAQADFVKELKLMHGISEPPPQPDR